MAADMSIFTPRAPQKSHCSDIVNHKQTAKLFAPSAVTLSPKPFWELDSFRGINPLMNGNETPPTLPTNSAAHANETRDRPAYVC